MAASLVILSITSPLAVVIFSNGFNNKSALTLVDLLLISLVGGRDNLSIMFPHNVDVSSVKFTAEHAFFFFGR